MENKVENINIEKNKELFEYEMTEVILKLKGEFAAFSGKDTRFADMVVDDAKLRINTSEVVQVQRENHHIETPAIGSVQQTEAARVEVKETILQLPVIPQISDEGGRKEKKAYNTEKADAWQGIVVPVLPSFSKLTIRKESPEKSLKEVETEIASSVEVPQLTSVLESMRDLKKKAYVTPASIYVPRTQIKYNSWSKDKSFVQYEKRAIQKTVPEMGRDSLLMSEHIKRLFEVQAVKKTDINVPQIAPNMNVDIDIKTEAYVVEVPQITSAGGSVQALPAITCESVQIKVLSTKTIEFHEFTKPITVTRRKQIQFQETHSFKCEIKKPTVVKAVTTVPELKHIQTYNVDDASIEHQAIVVPDVPKCNSISKNVDLKSAKASVSLPRTNISKQMSLKSIEVSGNDAFRVPSIPVVKKVDIPDIQDKNNTIFVPYKKAKAFGGASNIVCDMTPFTVCIPAVSFKKPKTLSPRKVEKHNMAIPIASPPRFSEMILVEHERSSTEIEIHPVKVNGNLGKVRISHYGTIAIPQKPEVKETVDNIIALAGAKS